MLGSNVRSGHVSEHVGFQRVSHARVGKCLLPGNKSRIIGVKTSAGKDTAFNLLLHLRRAKDSMPQETCKQFLEIPMLSEDVEAARVSRWCQWKAFAPRRE